MQRPPAGPPGTFETGLLRSIILIWIGWAALMIGYQVLAPARLAPHRPDYATAWTADETRADSHAGQPYLLGRFMNAHVAWDSEYYLSIATHGYDDPRMRAVSPTADPGDPKLGLKGQHPDWVSLNDAFFPAYPMAMRAAALPLGLFGLDPIAAATLAGVIISLVGALFAMIALADLAGRGGEEPDGVRAAFYLLILPASFFLAQVYTEGLFAGLSFSALMLLRRKQLVWAALLAVIATWTRATGALLLIPLAWRWLADGGARRLIAERKTRELGPLLLVASPALAYLAWRLTLGPGFAVVEAHYFGREAFALGPSAASWADAAASLWSGPPPARAYYLVEFVGLGFGLLSCILLWRRDAMLAVYGLAIIGVTVTSGAALGMHRYILAVPAVYLIPARWGRSPVFDRLWTLGNVLVMGLFALAFSVDFWAG
jgi:hypothetical protein